MMQGLSLYQAAADLALLSPRVRIEDSRLHFCSSVWPRRYHAVVPASKFRINISGRCSPMVAGLDMGGAFWFIDLTAPDPYLVFPLVTGASTLLNIEACAAILVACCI
jgi:hypothetical protein